VTHTPAEQPFLWCVGIEDTALGTPVRDGGRTLDEYELTGHYGRWREDLDLAAQCGATAIRYGIPWSRVNPAPGEWDWSFTDAALEYAADRLGLTVIADLVHYGTPSWLAGSFTDPAYPRAVADYAAAVAGRYAGLVDHYTPLNEPLVTASFCGRRAVWPPYEHGDAGWSRVTVAVADGLQQATRAIRDAHPGAVIAHVEAAGLWRSDDPSLHAAAAEQNRLKFLPTDLMTGAVDAQHPLRAWLLGNGIEAATLDRLHDSGVRPDLIGVNYYPTLSGRELLRQGTEVVEVADRTWTDGLRTVLTGYHRRYTLPVFLSETALDGQASDHVDWLRASTDTVADLRAEGIPVVGYTWWPLFDFVDWSWASAGRIVEEFRIRDEHGVVRAVAPPTGDDIEAYLRRMGLYRLSAAEGRLIPLHTAAVDEFTKLTHRTALDPKDAS
jgi:beta-glucosidase